MARYIRALWVSCALAMGYLASAQRVAAHTGEGFHPEVLWDLLRTALIVVVAISVLIGALWLYRQRRPLPRK